MTEILSEPVTAEMPPYLGGIVAGDDTPADSPALRLLRPAEHAAPDDRPGWIPPHILYDWDTDPYAYQTEEELMPAGGPHGEFLTYIPEVLRDFYRRKGMRFLVDTFLLYLDRQGKKQRVGPDFTLIPFRSPAPSSYDLGTEPLPRAVVEITSPKSRPGDMDDKAVLYAGLGIRAYLVVELHTPRGELRDEIRLHLWRKKRGRIRKMQTEADEWLTVPEMGVRIRAEGQELIFLDIVTDEILCDTGQLRERAEQEAALRKQAEARAEQEKNRAEQEAALCKQAEARAESAEEENRLLREKLRAAGILPD